MTGSRKIIRGCSIYTLLSVSCCLLAKGDAGLFTSISAALFCASTVISLSIVTPADGSSASRWTALLASVTLSGLSLVPGESYGILICSGSFFSIGYTAAEWLAKSRDIKNFFNRDLAWTSLEQASQARYRELVMFSAIVGFIWPAAAAVMLAAWYAGLYYSSYSGRPLMMRAAREEKIKETIKSYPRMVPQLPEKNENNMSRLFNRIEELMKERRPYLRDDFSIEDMSRAVYSNKTYVSRTINYFSGRNFKQYVNWYRVEYATDLIKRDPRLSVSELASMSGFHSAVTMNMAFKLYCNTSPGCYKREQDDAKRLSRTAEDSP